MIARASWPSLGAKAHPHLASVPSRLLSATAVRAAGWSISCLGSKGLFDCPWQTVCGVAFRDERKRPDLHRASSCLHIISGAQDDDLDVWDGFLDATARLQPIHLRQEDIGDHDVRLQKACGLEQALAILDEPYDVAKWFEQAFERREDPRVIVRQQNARSSSVRGRHVAFL